MDNDFYSVIVSEKAKKMLVSHVAFLAKVSPTAAEKLVEDFQETASSLQNIPNRCPWLSGSYIPKHQYRYIVFGKRYMLIYQIVDKTVYVDYCIDCRQDYGWLLK
ncbi:MAG: type II toxin-antitoxin system RelE/ParE family toxin [Clostridia bacterium]|nr:type II toxin-antitoxin system RelE/ParE family toxin [Clostridia bacterium]